MTFFKPTQPFLMFLLHQHRKGRAVVDYEDSAATEAIEAYDARTGEKLDTSNVKCFFCKEKGHTRKDCPKFSAWLAEKKTVGHEQSANSIEEDERILALDHEHEELCELIMIDSGASVHVSTHRDHPPEEPPEHLRGDVSTKKD